MPTADNAIHRSHASKVLRTTLGVGFVSTLSAALFSFVFPLANLEARVAGFWIGSGFAGYFAARLFISPLAGVLADRHGPRRILLAAATLSMAAPCLALLWPHVWTLYVVQGLLGVAAGAVRPTTQALLGVCVQPGGGARAFSLHGLVFHAALFTGPVLGGWAYAYLQLHWVLIGLIALQFAMVWLVARLPKSASTVVEEADQASSTGLHPLERWSLASAVFGRTVGLGAATAFYPILLTARLGDDPAMLAFIFVVPSLSALVGLLASTRLQSRGSFSAAMAGMALSAAGVFGLGASETVWRFVVFGGVVGAGAALSIPHSMGAFSGLGGRQGALFGRLNVLSGSGFIVGPMLVGLLLHWGVALGDAFKAVGLLGLLACAPAAAAVLQVRGHFSKTVGWTATAAVVAALVGVGVVAMPTLFKAPSKDGFFQHTDVAMGTVVNLTLAADSQDQAEAAAREVMALIGAMQRDLDHRNAAGSIGRINRAAGGRWVKPSPSALALVRRAVAYAEGTDGAFDPTVGALTMLPYYYALDEQVGRERRALVDYRRVLFDDAGGVKLEKPGMALDLGGVAKGAIIDAAVELLREQGIEAGIVEAGGDMFCFGDREWVVGVQRPRGDGVAFAIRVREQGVCGSGDYRRFVVAGGEDAPGVRHHIVDPATLTPADEAVGVTVVADSAELADALATAAFVLGPERGRAALAQGYPGAAALWFAPNGDVVATDNFPR